MKNVKKPSEYKVSLRGGFSDRMGIKPENRQMQVNDFDQRTRTALFNELDSLYHETFNYDYGGEVAYALYSVIMSEVYTQAVNHDSNNRLRDYEITLKIVGDTIFNDDYDSVLTVIEYVVQKLQHILSHYRGNADAYHGFNAVFQREYVGYRFINGFIVPITEKAEVVELEDALTVPFDNVHKHIEKAMMLLSDRDNPDYENSIKESVSAVEAMAGILTGKNETLGAAIKEIEKKEIIKMHPALREAILKIYGYAGDDEAGIRHAAKIGGKDSTFEEARFMLVTSSAFVNYLKGNMKS